MVMREFKLTILMFLALISIVSSGTVSAQTNNNKLQDIQAALPVIDKIFKDFADSNHLPGFIYGLVTGMTMPDAAEFGVAASALKHTIPGDLNHATLSDVKELMKGDGSGRVQR